MQQNEQVELLNRRRWSVIVRYRCPATWRWISNIFPLDWSSWWNLGKPSSPALTVPATNIYQPPDHHKIKYYIWLELAFMFERCWSDSCCWWSRERAEHSFIHWCLACFTISCSQTIWGRVSEECSGGTPGQLSSQHYHPRIPSASLWLRLRIAQAVAFSPLLCWQQQQAGANYTFLKTNIGRTTLFMLAGMLLWEYITCFLNSDV